MTMSPISIPIGIAAETMSVPSRTSGHPIRRFRRRFTAGLIAICMLAVWPMLFLLPLAAVGLSWWLGVM